MGISRDSACGYDVLPHKIAPCIGGQMDQAALAMQQALGDTMAVNVIQLTEANIRFPLASLQYVRAPRFRGADAISGATIMTGADKVVCQAATLLLLFTLTSAPAKAQFAGFGGGGGDTMTQIAPMLEMMKAKMGKRRFAMMMQTMGPMMSKMMEGGGGGLDGMAGGGIPGGLGGMIGGGGIPGGFTGGGSLPGGMGTGGSDIMGMIGGGGGGDLMGMIPQLMRMADFGGGGHRRHRRR